ncbi:YbaK/EbsC family protein [Cytobacillus sp. FJAT-54145]|uniref:YbaK/EbsC family protein n=1 Tax=Cytobacillus spartinae TaxID=3299023 RepID=A0ABW6KGE8_9BACI
MPLKKVEQFLKNKGLDTKPIVFETKMETAQEAADLLEVSVGQIAKSLLFRSEDKFGLFVVAGDVKVKERVIKHHLGKKPKMASAEQVIEKTGFVPGAVCPFALEKDIPIFIDVSLKRYETFYTAGGIAESLVEISFEDLCMITNGEVVETA